MADVVCSKCNVGWVIYSHDKHCGYCGCNIFDFSVKWKEEPLLYTDGGVDIYDLTILVENTGAYPITFQPIGTKRDNTIQFPQQNNAQFVVRAGQTHSVPIQVNTANLARHTETITVRAHKPPSNLEVEKLLNLQALPRPEFRLTPNPAVVRYRKGTEKVTVDLHLEALRGRFYFSSIKFTEQWVKGIRCPKGPYVEGTAAKNVPLDIGCNQLKDELNEVELRFKLLGFSQTIEKKIQIQREIVPEPARLFVPKMNLEITQEREKTYTLTLQNTGERPLIIKNIVFKDPTNLVQLQDIEFPINIASSEYQNVEIRISAGGIEPDTYPINFTINSNCQTTPQYQDILNIRVNKQEEYPHYLAIDFGTTNSCCAYIDLDTSEPRLIPLDGNKENPLVIMPSSIVYHSNPTNGKTYHVGYNAENYRTSEIDGPYYISSVKRWLGYQWGRPFPNNQILQPCNIVSDILNHVIKQAENHLDMQTKQSKVTKCVISHPTMFSARQREDLKIACEKIGITDLIFIDEASAASMGYIAHYLEKHQTLPNNLRMLVYDFGGGTIDIVLSQVKNQSNEYTIEPLSHGGDRKYGGDDITQAIVAEIIKEFKQKIQRANENLRVKFPYFKLRTILESSGNPKIDRASQYNTSILYSRAEEMKKELSKQQETNRDFPLSIYVGNDVRPLESLIEGSINIKFTVKQLQSLVEPKLNETFKEIDAMIAENGGHPPDTVVLAGQSSKMPLLARMMTAHLQKKYVKDIPIETAGDLKACVVIGAAQYSLAKRLQGAKFQIAMVDKTHSRLGIVRLSGLKPIFGEIIPKGRRIPKESWNSVEFPLDAAMVSIDVREHFGRDNNLINTSRIGKCTTITFQDGVSEKALREANLKMAVKDNGEIEVVALVDGKEHKLEVQKIAPEFVNEI